MEMSVRARIRAGDSDAFGSLFDEYARAVHNHAFRLTGDWSAAEDVLSLTFLEAWRLRQSVDPDGGSLRPWLLGIATNVVRNTRRAARRHEAALHRLPREEVFPDFAEELVGRIDDAGRVAALQGALSRLRRPEREVVALCIWSGLDYAAAAEALDIPVGTVRSRLSRARKKLHKYAAATGLSSRTGNSDRGRGQIDGDRVPAVRPTQEDAR
ncbi:RNA polymerase sigma factor [Streptomyces sp. NPDC006482]|uniref:RNA polymerase sigma factor n=1 Tax=Streptomyces sp. NPDC006482 TaxID=3154306 RepID=UPI0033BF4438